MGATEVAALSIVGVLIAMDYLTGLMKAVHAHDISSEKMREGLWHKSGLVLVCCWPRSWNAASHGSTWASRCR